MVVARASGTLMASSLKQNKFWLDLEPNQDFFGLLFKGGYLFPGGSPGVPPISS